MENYENEIIKELHGIREELQGIKRKGFKQIVSIVITALIAIAIGTGCGVYIDKNWDDIIMEIKPGVVSEETVTIIEEKLSEEAKLVTSSDTINANYDSGKIYKTVLGKKVPLSSKSFSFSYTGTVDAGIKDLSKAHVKLDPETQIITIVLPKVEILGRSLDTKNLNNSEQSKNFFNQITLEDFNNAQETLKNQMQTQALKSGIIENAKMSAEKMLKELLQDETTGYQVQFEWAE